MKNTRVEFVINNSLIDLNQIMFIYYNLRYLQIKIKSMRFLLSFLIIFIFTNLFAQDPKSQAILDKLSLKMKSYKTFYIEFSALIKNTTSGQNDNTIGKGWVKGDKYFANYGENTVVSNGLKTWNIAKDDKSVYESDNDDSEESLNPKKIMTLWENGFKNKYEKEAKLNAEIVIGSSAIISQYVMASDAITFANGLAGRQYGFHIIGVASGVNAGTSFGVRISIQYGAGTSTVFFSGRALINKVGSIG